MIACTFSLLGCYPIQVSKTDSLLRIVAIKIRQTTSLACLLVLVVYPICLGYLLIIIDPSSTRTLTFTTFYWHTLWHNSLIALPLILICLALRWLSIRYIVPTLSNLKRHFRAPVNREKLSDIRFEKLRFKAKQFDPRKFIKKNNAIFLGLNDNSKPFYFNINLFKTNHMEIIAPTQVGKGVLIGCLIYQCIKEDHGVFYLDPKGDLFIPHIMAEAAKQFNRKFIYLDLTCEQSAGYHPFIGGNIRDARKCLLQAFGLEDSGNESDFYKSRERVILDKLFQHSRKIRGLTQQIQHNEDLQENAQRLFDHLKEWEQIQSLNPKSQGFSVAKSILNNAVVYVKGNLADDVIKKTMRSLIYEITQESIRLFEQRTKHLSFFVDEVRFLASQQLVDALATILGFKVNMVLAYQSLADLKNLPDVKTNSDSIATGIHVNCQLKFIYGTQDPDTAKWAADMSGTQYKFIEQREIANVGQLGEERWSEEKTMENTSEAYLPINTFLSLPPRVGTFYQPYTLPEIVYTCFIPVAKNTLSQPEGEKNGNEP